MPPHSQETDINHVSFINSFWSKDKSGMNQLLGHMKSTHDDLDIIYTIYTQRSQLEHEFGEKLLSLSSIQDDKRFDMEGVPAAYHAIAMELEKTANSHLELSEKLNNQVTCELEQTLDEYKVLLEKWTKTLDELYNERQEKTTDLLKIRAKYLKEHDISKGQSTPTMDILKNQYKSLVAEVDELSQEWNSTWKDACEVMEAMEKDRIEFLKSNVWEYANLASARLLIEDEWCETIRNQLEKCSAEQEIERCISKYGTGSRIPTTNEYVGEQMREQKKKIAPQAVPSVKPSRKQEQQLRVRSQQTKQVVDDRSNSKEPRQQSRDPIEQSYDDIQHKHHRQKPPQPRQNDEREEEEYVQKRSNRPQQQQRQADVNKPSSTNASPPQQQQQTTEECTFIKEDEERINHIRGKVSDSMGSTAARGQIKRKPLNKSLMDHVSNQMAMARLQKESEQEEETNSRSSSPQPTIKSSNDNSSEAPLHKKTNSNGSLESLLKTFEVISPVNNTTTTKAPSSPPSNAVVSDEARFRRQPSEYKPDAGSIPTRRGANTSATTRALQEVIDVPPLSATSSTSGYSLQDHFTHPIAPPKSPRPAAQQINPEIQQQQSDVYNQQNYQQPINHNQFPQQNYASSIQPQIPDQSAVYSHQQQQQYMGKPQYMGQQYMGQPQQQHMGQRSPMMQPQRSPMIQPQRSPMIQPQRSPMIQPQRSPMIQPQRSPMIQPLHSPMIQPATQQQQQHHFGSQRGGLPPPITIPVTNYGVTPQPSPAIAYANVAGGISPGGILPPPSVPYQQSRPTHHSDGRPILFWVRAKYDYAASDQGELSFKANTLIGILEADMTQQTWWMGAIWDEYRHTWFIAGSIPSNFMANA